MRIREQLEKEAARLRAEAQKKVDALRVGEEGTGEGPSEIPVDDLFKQVQAGTRAVEAEIAASMEAEIKSPKGGEPFGRRRRGLGRSKTREAARGKLPAAKAEEVTGAEEEVIKKKFKKLKTGGGKKTMPTHQPAEVVTPPPQPTRTAVPLVAETSPQAETGAGTPPPPKDPLQNEVVAGSPPPPEKPLVANPIGAEKPIPGSREEISEGTQETLDQKILRLKTEVEGLRVEYVKADYNETNAWVKMKKFFGKALGGLNEKEWQEKHYHEQENYRDNMYWQAQYQNALVDLQAAQLEQVKRAAGSGTGWKKEMADMVKFFDADEPLNLINARTGYRAGRQSWPTKILDSFGALGRSYNRLSMKEKLAITAACAGGTIALTLSGGAAAGALAALMVGGKRVFASAGLTVGMESLLDSSRTRYREKTAEKEIENMFQGASEQDIARLDAVIREKALAIDDKLQKAKLTKFLHKAGALTVGIAVGSGWLVQTAMEKFGDGEAVTWIKEHLNKGTPDTGDEVPADDAPLVADVSSPEENVADTPQETIQEIPQEKVTDTITTDTEEVSKIGGVPGTVETAETFAATSKEPQAVGAASGTPAETAETSIHPVNDFINRDIVVERGDSVWKISGKLADQLGLEGAQKTHFVDALKDKYGDVLLQEGETINFSQHGIDQGFVEKALQDARTLTPAESIAIETNNAKIDTFANANPEITLTNEVVNNILEAQENDGAAVIPEIASAGMPGGAFGQETIMMRSVSPEMSMLYDTRADDWYTQIFRMENASFGQNWLIDKDTIGRVRIMDILQDARLLQQGSFSGYSTGLDREQIVNFAEFFQGVSKSDIGFDRAAFFRENPNATVMDYLKKVAPLVNPGQRFGLYTTTQ